MQETLAEEGEQTEYFKKLSDRNLEQCGTLAEQLICLRSDLDRSRFDVLRIQRLNSASQPPSKNSSVELSAQSREFAESEALGLGGVEGWGRRSPALNKSTGYSGRREFGGEDPFKLAGESLRAKLPPKVPSILKHNSKFNCVA